MPKPTQPEKDRVLRDIYSALSDALFGVSDDEPSDIVERIPSRMTGWGASDRIEELWQLVQFLDQCLGRTLLRPDGISIFDAFARAQARAQTLLQDEVDALPGSVTSEAAQLSGAPKGTRLH